MVRKGRSVFPTNWYLFLSCAHRCDNLLPPLHLILKMRAFVTIFVSRFHLTLPKSVLESYCV